MQLPAAFLDEIRARTPLSELIGGRVRLTRAGRQWKGCCPFHDEKTPSFQVYDDHFHCYGCGAHGDAISFVMQSQGLGFMEAAAELASRCGLVLPQPSAEAEAAEAARRDAFSVLEAAARAFARRLYLPEGRAALVYLRERGLSEQTIRDFGLGWSGEGRGVLIAELGREGFSEALLREAGLLKQDGNSRASEFFFNRVMFPIRDFRGRVISFGGRVLGDGQPKYLNGPETPLFIKRRSLYGLDRARAALGRNPPIIVEGYMDVIALHQAGFATAVAPLGTALTEEQLQSLWRLAAAPIICFDGDEAGAKAAHRAIALALPMLAPGRSLSFVALPAGEDPDSLLRRGGADNFRAEIKAPEPLHQALFRLLQRETGVATPEQRASLRARLEAAAATIADRALGWEYSRSLRDLYFSSQDKRSQYPRFGARSRAAAFARPALDAASVAKRREQLVLATLIHYPWLVPEAEERLADIHLSQRGEEVRRAISDWWRHGQALDSAKLMSHLTAIGLAVEITVVTGLPQPSGFASTPEGAVEEARTLWWQLVGAMVERPRLKEDLTAVVQAYTEDPSPENVRRLFATKRAYDANLLGEDQAPD